MLPLRLSLPELLMHLLPSCVCVVLSLGFLTPAHGAGVDFSQATILVSGGDRGAAESVAPTVLQEEIARRTGLKWTVQREWPAEARAIIALSTVAAPPAWAERIPVAARSSAVLRQAEGFSIRVQERTADRPPTLFITGADSRGVLGGVGHLLRSCDWGRGRVSIAAAVQADRAPDKPLRGHQLGYRARANSWDAWTPAQFDQYIRELVMGGANAVENIPFEDSDPSVLMPVTRDVMNVAMSEICARYEVEYWLWVPVQFALPDAKQQAAFLARQVDLYRTAPRIDGVFVPGGDPGNNPARELLPYVRDMGLALRQHHPRARIWVSLQGFSPRDIDDFYDYVSREQPDWLGGVVMGPSSPPLDTTRARLPANYKLRWYPDITHTIRCQYDVPWFDPAFGCTLGREPVNPRPVDCTGIYRALHRFTDGFLTYSDGIHDDFNKQLWSQLGWDPNRNPRDIAIEYARCFFRPDLAELGADALFALENNWRGSLAENAAVDGTLRLWQQLADQLPAESRNWRFDLHLLRAYYDAYTRHRLLYESELERAALRVLGQAGDIGVTPALEQAREILERATTQPTHPEWYTRLDTLADGLFQSIGYQTRLERHHASGSERGAVMDFVNYPLNNRWWLEDEFDRIAQLDDRSAQLARIERICHWDQPGPGSFYDNLGHVGQSPRVPKLLYLTDALRFDEQLPIPTQRWMGSQRRPLRQSWHTYLGPPPALVYTGLDPQARYTVRLFAQRTSPLLIDGERASLIRRGETYDQVQEQEFEVPATAVADGKVELTWERLDESDLNWRNRHYVCELWLLKQPRP